MATTLIPHRGSLFLMVFCAALFVTGCSDSPTDPAPPGGGGNEGEIPADSPAIPRPSTIGGDVPAQSEVATRIRQLGGTFRPLLENAYGQFNGQRQCSTDPQPLPPFEGWSQDLRSDPNYGRIAVELSSSHRLLQNDTGERPPIQLQSTDRLDCGPWPLPDGIVVAQFEGVALEADVYVRRDRHWERRALADGSDFKLLYPGTTSSVSTSYTKGVAQSQTEEFGRSVTVEAGASYGVLSASVSGTLSETFSSTVEISKSETKTFTETVAGQDGKVVQYMLWELVEIYSFCDAQGAPLTSLHYVFAPTSMERRGVATALQATAFDLP